MKGTVNSNNVTMVGRIVEEIKQHGKSQNVVETKIAIKRASGVEDVIPVLMERNILIGVNHSVGSKVNINGVLGSRNKDGHLHIYVFAYSISTFPIITEINDVEFDGFVCVAPKYRKTPKGREITDIMVAINDKRRSCYIPCMLWGRNARRSAFFEVGTRIKCKGRFQSRVYQKVTEDGIEDRVTYEISLSSAKIVEDKERANGQI